MQHYKVVFSDIARQDLADIVVYLRTNECENLAKYVEKNILSEAKRLKTFPEAYPKDFYASTEQYTVRFILKWRYKILFTVNNDNFEVYIIGIFHTSQNPQKLETLFED